MKPIKSFLIFPIGIMGLCLLLMGGCEKDEDDPLKIQTVDVPAGTFMMGSAKTEVGWTRLETQHEVTLSAFKMCKYEITNAQYAVFLNEKKIGTDGLYAAGAFPTERLVLVSSGELDWGLHFTDGVWVPAAGYENNPAVYVTWYGAVEYATYKGGRLPTEAELEYATRAGTTTPFSTGECLTDAQANYFWNFPYSTCTNTIKTYLNTTQPVGTYPPNAWGIYDLHGNAWEWCSDWSGLYPTTPQTNPVGVETGIQRVRRGGSCRAYARDCRSAARDSNFPNYGDYSLGFRVVFPM
jgi:formylglycine-generating enzyme required for sulfatase activity